MTLAPAAIFKIPTESPQPSRKAARPARKAKAARPAPGRVLANGTGRTATRGGGEVIELDYGITVYPDREDKGRWRAVWYEDGKRQQTEAGIELPGSCAAGPTRSPSRPSRWRPCSARTSRPGRSSRSSCCTTCSAPATTTW